MRSNELPAIPSRNVLMIGNAAGDRRFEIERDVFLLGDRGKLDAMPGEQRLVGGHDDLPDASAASTARFGRLAVAADQFDEDVDVRLARERERVGEPFHLPRSMPRSLARERAHTATTSMARPQRAVSASRWRPI